MDIKRKIYFYGIGARENRSRLDGSKLKSLLSTVRKLLAKKKHSAVSKFEPAQGATDVIGHVYDSVFPCFGEIAYVRNSALPAVRNKVTAKIKPLKLGKNEDVYEPSHFLLTDDGILGLEYNFHAPRAGTLERHLNEILALHKPTKGTKLKVMPITKHTGLDPLGNIGNVRSFKVKVATNWAKLIAKRDSSMRDLFASAHLTDGQYITVILDGGRKKQASLGDDARSLIEKVYHAAGGDYKNLRTLEVKGRTLDGRLDVLDLIEEHVMSEEDAITVEGNTKLISKASIRKALGNAYLKRKDELSQYAERRD